MSSILSLFLFPQAIYGIESPFCVCATVSGHLLCNTYTSNHYDIVLLKLCTDYACNKVDYRSVKRILFSRNVITCATLHTLSIPAYFHSKNFKLFLLPLLARSTPMTCIVFLTFACCCCFYLLLSPLSMIKELVDS